MLEGIIISLTLMFKVGLVIGASAVPVAIKDFIKRGKK